MIRSILPGNITSSKGTSLPYVIFSLSLLTHKTHRKGLADPGEAFSVSYDRFCLRRPHFFQQRDEGIPRLRARVTFALGGKSDQKRRSNLRFEDPLTPRTQGFAVLRPTWTRQGENHPKCGIDLLLSPLPLKTQNVDLRSGAFQSKSGSAQRNTSVQHFGQIRTHRQAAEGNPKTHGFWRRSFPHFFR